MPIKLRNAYILIKVNDKKDLTNEEKTRQLKQYFLTKLSNIRQLSHTKELDKLQTTMGILFQHLRKDILKILVEILPDNQKSLILLINQLQIK